MLEEHANYEADASRITLLEGSPFARELEVLKRSFRAAQFPGLFRRSKIEIYKMSMPGPATVSPFQSKVTHVPSPAISTVKPAISSYAGAALVRPAAPPTPPPTIKSRSNSNSEVILRNKYGQRVSTPNSSSKTLVDTRPSRWTVISWPIEQSRIS